MKFMSQIRKYGNKIVSNTTRIRNTLLCASIVTFLAGQTALAAIPTPQAPSTAPPSGDYIGLAKGYTKDGVDAASVGLGAIIFILMASHMVTKFAEFRKGRAETGELVGTGITGVVVMMVAMWLLVTGAGVI